jgi:hypothetical protein
VEVHNLGEVVRQALGNTGACGVLLRFRATANVLDDYEQVNWALPWLRKLQRPGMLAEDLHYHGLGVVICVDEEEARRLVAEIRGQWVWAEVVRRAGQP